MQFKTLSGLASTPHTLARKLIIALLLLASLAQATADMYVPSLPAIAAAFKANAASIQFTLTAFMLGFSAAHLVYGPLSDKIGRRTPILVGVGLSVIGSAFCLFAMSVSMLIIGRFIQGIGVATCNSVVRSLVRDLLTGIHFAKLYSHLGMLIVLVIATAPALGGYIQCYTNWRMVFLVLFIYTIGVWIYSWKVLPETNVNLNADAMRLNTVLKSYWLVLTNKIFIGFTICASMAYAGIVAYITFSPFLMQNVIGLTPLEYGWLSFVPAGSIFTSFFINSRLILRSGIKKLVCVGSLLMLLGGLLMYFFMCQQGLNVWVVMVPFAVFCLGVGFTFANASAGAFNPFASMVGVAGALFGCLQILGGAVVSRVVAKLHVANQSPLALMFISAGLISFLSWRFWATQEMPD